MIGIILGFEYPETCEGCKLFVDGILGHSAFCAAGGEYTYKEIKEANGATQMYYHGCLTSRPKNCPLKEVFLDDGEEEGEADEKA